MIAYYFPPLGGIGSLRAMKFAEHLPEFGWEPTVLAPRLGTHYEDRELTFPEERVLRSKSVELSRLGKRALRIEPGTGNSGKVAGPKARLRRAAQRFLYRPDPQIGWYPGAVWTGLRALKRGKFDAIFSTSVPMTAHLVARRLHNSTGLPWVVEFRDPWSERTATDDPARAEGLERSVAAAAAEVVMTSPTWARTHAERWGCAVTPILAGAEPSSSSEPPSGLIVSHLGTVYPDQQDLSAALAALRTIVDAGEVSPVRLRFIGEIPSALRADLEREGLSDFAEVTGFVPHHKALDLLASSSVLLGAGPRDRRESLRGLIPAKVLEYLATDVPILYLSHTPNDGAELLEQSPGTVVLPPDDVDGAVQALLRLRADRYPRDQEALSWRSRAGQLAALLDPVTRSDR
jgi:glycosyltransferase involved in cell wall biosynthesis